MCGHDGRVKDCVARCGIGTSEISRKPLNTSTLTDAVSKYTWEHRTILVFLCYFSSRTTMRNHQKSYICGVLTSLTSPTSKVPRLYHDMNPATFFVVSLLTSRLAHRGPTLMLRASHPTPLSSVTNSLSDPRS